MNNDALLELENHQEPWVVVFIFVKSFRPVVHIQVSVSIFASSLIIFVGSKNTLRKKSCNKIFTHVTLLSELKFTHAVLQNKSSSTGNKTDNIWFSRFYDTLVTSLTTY